VPYKGGGAAVTDLLSGQVSMYFSTTPSSMPFVRAGRLRALAVTSARRSAVVPEVPTIAESGLPGFEQSAWHGIFAPAGTPPAIVGKLNEELVRILHMPDTAERLAAQGVDVVASSPAEFAAFIRQDVAKYAKLIRTAGIRVD
jgi:tripartite-type tricarboxylate transporter receptor subunit TctC